MSATIAVYITNAANARIAKQALHTGRPEEIATELGLLPAETVKSLLAPHRLARMPSPATEPAAAQ
ncbi:hypothetical protein ACW2Q0_25465 [Nocardia sp. R16R-3T]